jgi:hypothetical protein
MKLSMCLAGVLLLLIYGGSSFPTISVHWGFVSFDVANPLNLVASIVLVSFWGFSLTIGWILLGFTALFLLVGVFT